VWRAGRELAVELVAERRGCFTFRLRAPGFQTRAVSLAVPGAFNVDNAALALALSVGLLGGDAPSLAARAASATLAEYPGARRRFEPWGTVGGIQVVHDYAHHPTEVRVTLEGARRALPGMPLHVLFQPHQASRTARFLGEFAESLRFADRVVISDVYGARRHIDGGNLAGAEDLAQELRARGVVACAAGPLTSSVRVFAQALPDPCAALVIGAGDVEGIQHELLESLALRCAVPGPARR
jgi:UDP-N-acetylmuramate--alanine ligase